MLSLEYQIEHFCDNCPHCYDCGGFEEFWGAMVYRPEWTCAAEGDPEDLACPEGAEYKALLADLDEQNREDDEEDE